MIKKKNSSNGSMPYYFEMEHISSISYNYTHMTWRYSLFQNTSNSTYDYTCNSTYDYTCIAMHISFCNSVYNWINVW